MIRTLIVEDEPLARDLLRSYIARHSDLELVGEAENGNQALTLLNNSAPDLMLLDIGLPGMSGLELARQTQGTVAIIFVTAYDDHAITAFELGAFDYLRKPVLPERFASAVQRIRDRRQGSATMERSQERLNGFAQEGYLKRFFVRHLGTVVPVNVEDIVRLESDDDYTAIFVNGKRLLIHLPLREMAVRLDPGSFVRVHRCDVVNLAHVSSFLQRDRRFVLTLSDGSQVVSSRAGSQALIARQL